MTHNHMKGLPSPDEDLVSKVPAVTLGFWVIKVLATTLGETGGDTVTMSLLHADGNAHNGGYLIGTGIFLIIFIAAAIGQIVARKFNPWIYWLLFWKSMVKELPPARFLHCPQSE